MVQRSSTALLGFSLVVLLSACGADATPLETPKTPAEACADLQVAVSDFYDVASPNSTLTVLDVTQLPEVNGFTIPRPDCAFELRPDPAMVAGDVFTVENFYLDYDETMTLTVAESLEAAGWVRPDPAFRTWTKQFLGKFSSASLFIFRDGDEQPYTEAADGRVLGLSVGQA